MSTFNYQHEDYDDKITITVKAKGVMGANVYIMATCQTPAKWHLVKEKKKESFGSIAISREDIKHKFPEKYHKAIDSIPDDHMEGIGYKVGDIMMSGGDFWMAIEYGGEDWFMDYYEGDDEE